MFCKFLEHCGKIVRHAVGRYPHEPDALGLEVGLALSVSQTLGRVVVDTAVYFNGALQFGTEEVEDVLADGVLAPELVSGQPAVTELLPHDCLGWRLRLSEVPRGWDVVDVLLLHRLFWPNSTLPRSLVISPLPSQSGEGLG